MLIAALDSDCFVLGSIEKLCRSKFPRDEMIGFRNGWCAIEGFKSRKPDLVIIEPELRDCDGLTLVPSIRRANPKVKILGFSQCCDQLTALRIQRTGLDGFLCKRSSGPDELADYMKRVVQGERCFDRFISRAQARLRYDSAGFTKLLSDRELEFLGAIGAGLNNEDLAVRFKVSVSTANNHRAAIMGKLSITRTPELMRFAVENGLTRLASDFGSSELRPVSIQ